MTSGKGNAGRFVKGDPRIAKHGPMCRERAAWANEFLNALAKKLTPEMAADTLIAAFKAKQSWAVIEVMERLVGKVTQPIGGEGGDGAIRIEVVHVGGDKGNGHGGEAK